MKILKVLGAVVYLVLFYLFIVPTFIVSIIALGFVLFLTFGYNPMKDYLKTEEDFWRKRHQG